MAPSREMVRLLGYIHNQVDRSFADLIEEPWGKIEKPRWQPPVDVYETTEAYLLVIELPGVKPENIDVRLYDEGVIVCGRREATHTYSSANQVLIERLSGRFCRNVALDQPVDLSGMQIRHEHGLCELILPKLHT